MTENHRSKRLHYYTICIPIIYSVLLFIGCKSSDSKQVFESPVPVSMVPNDKPYIFSYDEGTKIWDINSIPDRNETRMEFPHLAWFKGHLYCSFREGDSHGNHISGRGRVIRSADGVNWETVALFESATGDVRDPRLSVSTDGVLVVNASIAFIEEVAPFQVIDGQTVSRQSVTWLSADGENWSEPYSCPTGINTWRWDMAWHKGYGYSIGYGEGGGTLYRTSDGKTWQKVKENLFPDGHGNEAGLTFGDDGTLYVLLRGGLAAHVAFGVAQAPYDQDWEWSEVDSYWDGPEEKKPTWYLTGGADLGGPDLITLDNGQIFGAGRVNREERANYFLIDPADDEETLMRGVNYVMTRVAGVRNGSSYPGIVEINGHIWLSYCKGDSEGVYIKRIKLPGQ